MHSSSNPSLENSESINNHLQMGNVGATGGNDYANNNVSPIIDLNNALEIEMEHSPR